VVRTHQEAGNHKENSLPMVYNQSSWRTPDDGRDSAVVRFEAFNAAHPAFYDTLVDLARAYLDGTGHEAVGMQRLIEHARWDLELGARGELDIKLNNDLGAYYSRLIQYQERDLAGRIPTRRSPGADEWIDELRKRDPGDAA